MKPTNNQTVSDSCLALIAGNGVELVLTIPTTRYQVVLPADTDTDKAITDNILSSTNAIAVNSVEVINDNYLNKGIELLRVNYQVPNH